MRPSDSAPRSGQILRVGLTGGIASGKSTVSSQLRAHGAIIIDYDLLAREVVEPGTPALAAIVERFGDEIIDPVTGGLDRPALGAIVFSDEQARRDLEAITHPAIRARAIELERGAPAGSIVVHDNPLLVEMGGHVGCDVVIVVDVPADVQLQRLIEDRGMGLEDARARLAAQTSREERTAVADVIVDNSGSVDQLTARIDQVWREELVREASRQGE